ncbi:MAG: acylphosphatase [Ferruginibacter sp.]
MPTKHLLITGKVQGVFYRAAAKEIAGDLQITGWIRNTLKGKVEAVVSGTEANMEKFISWCHHGPSHAQVTSVNVTESPEEEFLSFSVKRG